MLLEFIFNYGASSEGQGQQGGGQLQGKALAFAELAVGTHHLICRAQCNANMRGLLLKNLCAHVYSSITHNSPKAEATQGPTDRRMDKFSGYMYLYLRMYL